MYGVNVGAKGTAFTAVNRFVTKVTNPLGGGEQV
jgi:hypothetical protein